MTLLELIEDFRQRIADNGGDRTVPSGYSYYWEYSDAGCLWKNKEIVNYFNWSQNEIALRRPYRDSTTTNLCVIPIKANTARYALDPLILSIEEVTLASTGQSLTKTTVRDLRVWAAGSSSLDINAWKTKTGSPQYYSEDVEPGKITLIPVPVATTDTLLLTVYRLPLEPLDWENRDSDLTEPPAQLREAILQGALIKAYQKRDADTADPNLSALHEKQFNLMVGAPVDYQTLENRRWNANLDTSIIPAGYSRKSSRRSWMDNA